MKKCLLLVLVGLVGMSFTHQRTAKQYKCVDCRSRDYHQLDKETPTPLHYNEKEEICDDCRREDNYPKAFLYKEAQKEKPSKTAYGMDYKKINPLAVSKFMSPHQKQREVKHSPAKVSSQKIQWHAAKPRYQKRSESAPKPLKKPVETSAPTQTRLEAARPKMHTTKTSYTKEVKNGFKKGSHFSYKNRDSSLTRKTNFNNIPYSGIDD